VGARFLLCCIYTQVHAVTMVTWWEGGNHQDLFLRVYRCVHTDLLEFQSAQKTIFFSFFERFIFHLHVRSIYQMSTDTFGLAHPSATLYGTHPPFLEPDWKSKHVYYRKRIVEECWSSFQKL
jgi:hypothetical protein